MSLQYLIEIVVQIGFCYHAVRTGRNQWMFIILFLPLIGWLAYLVIEILPGYVGGPAAQKAKLGVAKALNPNKELKDAKHNLEIAPTVINRIRYARLLLDRSAWDEAIEVLKPALTNFFADDPAVLEGLAEATFEKKDYPQSLTYIDAILANKEWPVKAHIELLRARILEIQNQPGPAEELFSRLAKTSPGEEAKVAYAQFLVRQNRKPEATAIFADIVKRSKYMSPHARKMDGEWIRLAQKGV